MWSNTSNKLLRCKLKTVVARITTHLKHCHANKILQVEAASWTGVYFFQHILLKFVNLKKNVARITWSLLTSTWNYCFVGIEASYSASVYYVDFKAHLGTAKEKYDTLFSCCFLQPSRGGELVGRHWRRYRSFLWCSTQEMAWER